jgi:hypothetical protein
LGLCNFLAAMLQFCIFVCTSFGTIFIFKHGLSKFIFVSQCSKFLLQFKKLYMLLVWLQFIMLYISASCSSVFFPCIHFRLFCNLYLEGLIQNLVLVLVKTLNSLALFALLQTTSFGLHGHHHMRQNWFEKVHALSEFFWDTTAMNSYELSNLRSLSAHTWTTWVWSHDVPLTLSTIWSWNCV